MKKVTIEARHYTLKDAYMRERARLFHQQALTYLARLKAKDPEITEEFLELMTKAIEDAQLATPEDGRLAERKEKRELRDDEMDEVEELMADLFFYGAKGYGKGSVMLERLGQHAWQHAGKSVPMKLQAATLGFKTASLAEVKEVLTVKGMSAADITRLGTLLGETGNAQTQQMDQGSLNKMNTEEYINLHNAVWDYMKTLHEAADRAFAREETLRRLFLLYPEGYHRQDEEHQVKVSKGESKSFKLDSPVSDAQVYLFRCSGDEGKVLVQRSVLENTPGSKGFELSPMKRDTPAVEHKGFDIDTMGDYLTVTGLEGRELVVKVRLPNE